MNTNVRWGRMGYRMLVVTICAAAWTAGCSPLADEFRAAATPSLRTGVNALLDGIVEGVFAVVEPNSNSTDNSTATPGAP